MLILRNIHLVVTGPKAPVRLDDPDLVQRLPNAAIGIEDGRISWIKSSFDAPVPPGAMVIDAGGGCAIPGLIDCHTHTVFAGTREHEFVQRIEGRTYAEIAESGGGIRTTMTAVRAASVDELVELALPRLQEMLAWGVTTVEIKSGYGLSAADELKMLEAVEQLRKLQPIELVSTYLAAHTTPPEFAGRSDAYLDEVLAPDVLRQIAERQLAEFIDVFCEKTAFSVEQARRVLQAGAEVGLGGRVHADQITQMGASRLAAEMKALSADHLEHVDAESLRAMATAGTIGVLLPACSMFLGVPQAPAKAIIEAGVPMAIATDFNPGSCPVISLPLTMSLACTQLRLTPEQALVAATSNAAAVLRRADRLGALLPGMQADITVLDVPNPAQMCYFVGQRRTRLVIKNGAVVYRARTNGGA
jgi:imidazolonepropionase